MPIYEFYCHDCHTVFNFFSRRIDTEKRPSCPKCQRQWLERRVSLVSLSSSGKKGDEERNGGLPVSDETRMEQAMATVVGELEDAGNDDPRVLGRVMRRFIDAAGIRMTSGFEDAMRRLEGGEDPGLIEAEMGEVLSEGNPFEEVDHSPRQGSRVRSSLPPAVDDTLYEL